MDSTKQQKRLINEGIIQNILNWIVDRQYWKAKKMFEEDPELQKIYKRAFDAFEKAEKQAEDYCKKYGCVEPDKHTVKLEKFKDMRARDRKNKK